MKQLKLNKKDLASIVKKYNIGRFKKTRLVKTSGNLGSIINTSEGEYFLRLCGEGYRWRSKREIEGELNLIGRLIKNKFPVIDYERTINNTKVISIKGRNGYIRKFIKARQVKGNPTERKVYKVGQTLGKFHQIVKNYKANDLRKNLDFGVEETKKYFYEEKNNILKSNFKDKNKFVEVFANEINKIKLPKNLSRGMIHEDLGKRHIFWQDNEIIAIIDFDRSYFGYLILDLGQALRGWCFINNWQTWSKDNFQSFLKGYQSFRKIATKEKKYLLPAIKFAILERALAFCVRYIYSSKPLKIDERFAVDSLFRQINKVKI